MIKYVLSFLSICCFLNTAHANEEGVVSLFEDEPQVQSKSSHKEEKSKATDKEDKEGFFSFMDLEMPKNMFSSDDSQKEKPKTIEDTIKLADRGDLQSQLDAGYAYMYGEKGLSVDHTKAFEYFSKAALQNDPVGLNNLGSLYYGGLGVKRSSAKAAVLFKKAADLGNTEAAENIGFMHASGNGAPQNMETAMKYFEIAATSDSPASKFMLGYAYYAGKYRDVDYIKAAPLIKFAADSGFDEAQTIVANMYIKGMGFPQNYNNAVKYLNKAIMQGNTEAMMNLADILVEGKKYNKDIAYAHVLYNLAAVRGVPTAAQKRNTVEASMKIDEVLMAQQKAGSFKEELSETTSHIRKTFGQSISSYFN